MSETVILELSEDLVRRAKAIALQSNQRFEEVLVAWLNSVATDPPIETLPDEQVLALCDAELDTGQQAQLSQLLALNREGKLTITEQTQLDLLMQAYRHGLVRKAQALKEAVSRGLKAPLYQI